MPYAWNPIVTLKEKGEEKKLNKHIDKQKKILLVDIISI